MNGLTLVPIGDDEFEVWIDYTSATESEFSLEFLYEKTDADMADFAKAIKEAFGNVKVKAVKVLLAGIVIATLAMPASAKAAEEVTSLGYFYVGSASQQVTMIDRVDGALNTVSPSYFDIDAKGNLVINPVSKELVDRAHTKGMKVVPFLSNHWDRAAGTAALAKGQLLAQQLADAVRTHNLDGVHVDFENVTHEHRAAYTSFVNALRAALPAGKEVSVAVAANPKGWTTGWHGSYDYAELARAADYLVIMAYDEHWQGSDPGAVAGLPFVQSSIDYALKHTTPDKIVLGVPFYGRLWSGDGRFVGQAVTAEHGASLLTKVTARRNFDVLSQTPSYTFTLTGKEGLGNVGGLPLAAGTYTLYMDDDASLRAKLDLVNSRGLRGSAVWSVGQENPNVWGMYRDWMASATSAKPTAPAPTVQAAGTVTATTLNVRAVGSTLGAILGKLSRGQSVKILSTAGGWHKVEYSGGKVGYVSGEYIQQAGAAAQTQATTRGIVTATTLNVRANGSTSAAIVAKLTRNTAVNILSTSGGWHRIELGSGKTGYVSVEYVRPDGTTTAAPQQSQRIGTVTAASLNVRSGASTNSAVVGSLKKGAAVTIISTANGWHQINYGGRTAYVSAGYVK